MYTSPIFVPAYRHYRMCSWFSKGHIFVFQTYPVFYADLVSQIREEFGVSGAQRVILHFEHAQGLFRPIESGADFDVLLNFRIHHFTARSFRLKLTIDESSLPLDAADNFRVQFPRCNIDLILFNWRFGCFLEIIFVFTVEIFSYISENSIMARWKGDEWIVSNSKFTPFTTFLSSIS